MPIIYRPTPPFRGRVIQGTPPLREVVPDSGFRKLPLSGNTVEGPGRLNTRSVAESPVRTTFYTRGVNTHNPANEFSDGVLGARDPQVLYGFEKET
jgi:hypothetical protein